MHDIIDALNHADFCSAILLIALLTFVGQRMVAGENNLQCWGLRLAAVAFVGFCAHGCLSSRVADLQAWLEIAVRGVLAAGLMLGAAWILLPIGAFVYRHTIGLLLRALQERRQAAELEKDRRQAHERDEAERQRLREEHERREQELERQRPLAEAQCQAEAEAQQRRADARAQCELLFSLYAPEIGKRFPRSMFEDFVRRYMGDGHPPEQVEQRAAQLQTTIQQHLEKVEVVPKFRSLEDITHWYQGQKTNLERLPDDANKRRLIAQLNAKYADMTTRWLEDAQP